MKMDRRNSWVRVIACFMVVLLHVSSQNFSSFGDKWWAANFFDSFSRACVPLFLMISGEALLKKDEALSVFFKKRCVRILPPLIFWSCFYLAWLAYNGVDVGNWIIKIAQGPVMYHLWYFYVLIGLYATVPVLRKFFLNSTKSEQVAIIAIWVLVASIYPQFAEVYNSIFGGGEILSDKLNSTYSLVYFSGYIGYFLLGAYVGNSEKNNFKVGFLIFFISSFLTMCFTYVMSIKTGKPTELLFGYLSPFVLAAAYGLFSMLMALKKEAPSKILSAISDCSLGIYCLHVLMIDRFSAALGISVKFGNPWIAPLVVSGLVFIASLAIIFVCRKVKFCRYVT
ncbi:MULTISPECIES: acyltransferase [unclassified Janthinobacterium]|uniref:acyltransferase n=1 Tax=unclassified Janthinobacterium TaxID=2610881 RepID=UPI000B8462B3|nr:MULTISPECIES: acyltransferase family protein [unclassified Janthinobacterium]